MGLCFHAFRPCFGGYQITMNKKIIVVILAVIILILVGFYFIYQKYYSKILFSPQTKDNSEMQVEKPAEIVKSDSVNQIGGVKNIKTALVSGYKLYKNMEFGFEIQYPVSWTVIEEINE